MIDSILPVILCGGSGTRLWPLSRESLPKQFVPLVGGRSLLSATLERSASVASSGLDSSLARKPAVLCVANESHRFLVADECDQAGVAGTILLEPRGRNTAAAMACAAYHAMIQATDAQPDPLLLFLPSDQYVPDIESFCQTVLSGVAAAREGWFVTFGVVPLQPSTAYGYIQYGDSIADDVRNDVRKVLRFVEKPNALKAAELLACGDHWWNAGIFLVSAKTLLAALERHAPDIFEAAGLAMHSAKVDGHFLRPGSAEFLNIRSESIDYAVLEHHDQIAVTPFAGAWSDVGSWNAVADLADPDPEGNRAVGQTLAIDCQRTYLHSPHRVVVALGLSDVLVIDTPDAVLVASASEAERVKDVVSQLRERGLSVATQHRRVARPWGEYDAIDSGDRFQVKRITVKPGEQLSLQMHHHRAEHWIVVRGTARVTRGDETFLLSENESTYIPLGTVHRLENPGRVPLEMIEVQSGSYLGEDDIVRFEDTYGRVVRPPGEAP
jgi:mannose-1-phosphate guanylyltransferase/mannose-6-phosphate isomerase